MRINEIFLSIEGEGARAGLPAVFVRIAGCSLRCTYCDTRYAMGEDNGTQMDTDDILTQISTYACRNVTITGGEPLEHPQVSELVQSLCKQGYKVNIETNGAEPIDEYLMDGTIITMDYKLPTSGMEHRMNTDNLSKLRPTDVLKFVAGTMGDLERMVQVLQEHTPKAQVFISPVFGSIEPKDIVRFVLDRKMFDCKVQLQLHKIIWDADTRGVR